MEKMKSFIGHKLLWYIDMCLNGKKLCLNINDNESFDINSGHFKELIAMIYVWMLKKNVFKTLIEFDSYTFFFVLTKLFSHDYLINIIKNYDYSKLPSDLVSEANELEEEKKEEETPKQFQNLQIHSLYQHLTSQFVQYLQSMQRYQESLY